MSDWRNVGGPYEPSYEDSDPPERKSELWGEYQDDYDPELERKQE